MKIVEIKKRIRAILKEGRVVRRIYDYVYEMVMKVLAPYVLGYYNKKCDVDNNQIMFFTFQGKYTCNMKYISEEIVRRGLPYKLVWVSRFGDRNGFPDTVKVVKRYSREYYKCMAQSKIWIDNYFNFAMGEIDKKPGQIYIDTWHGSLGIKKLPPIDLKKSYIKGAPLVDVCISNSSFEDEVYRTSYFANNKIERLGHARNDVLINCDEKIISILNDAIRSQYGINTDDKLALYAPTRRDYKNDVTLDADVTIGALTKRFGGKWKILVRAHSHEKAETHITYCDNVIDVTDYPDIQELMLVSDVGITDYSSWIFDYMFMRRPGFIFAPDVKQYDIERGFYYSLDSTPFSIALDNSSLCKNIEEYDSVSYGEGVEAFLDEKGSIDDGNASRRIVDYIGNIMDLK